MRITFILVILLLVSCGTGNKKARIEQLYLGIKYHDSLRNFDSSLALSNQLLKLDPKHLAAGIYRIKAIGGLGDTIKAIVELNTMIEKDPNDQAYLLKSIYIGDKDPKQAILLAHQALEINPDLDLAHAALIMLHTNSLYNRDSGLYYAHILEQRKTNSVAGLMAIENAYLANGTPQQIFDITTRVIEKNPAYPYSYNNRGYAEIKLQMFAEARRDIFKSLSIDSTNSYAYKNLGLLFIELKKKDSACYYLNIAGDKNFRQLYGNEVDSLLSIHCH